jgi:hypothetical protein
MTLKLKTKPVSSSFAILALVFAAGLASAGRADQTPTPAVMTALQDELDRSMTALSSSDPPVYFISYTVADRQFSEVSGSNGAVLTSTENRARWLEVQTRNVR